MKLTDHTSSILGDVRRVWKTGQSLTTTMNMDDDEGRLTTDNGSLLTP